MDNDVINIGKIPLNERFNYFKTIQLISKCKDEDQLKLLKSKLKIIVRRIELQMRLSNKITNYKASEWKYMIDDDCNFWMMKNDYIDRNFIIKEKE